MRLNLTPLLSFLLEFECKRQKCAADRTSVAKHFTKDLSTRRRRHGKTSAWLSFVVGFICPRMFLFVGVIKVGGVCVRLVDYIGVWWPLVYFIYFFPSLNWKTRSVPPLLRNYFPQSTKPVSLKHMRTPTLEAVRISSFGRFLVSSSSSRAVIYVRLGIT